MHALAALWLLTALPGMGSIEWGCDAHASGYHAYRLAVDARPATATETIELWARGRRVARRRVDGGLVRLPAAGTPVQRLLVTQSTEPGTLRAVITVDFRPGRISPSHCWAHLPPRFTVALTPR